MTLNEDPNPDFKVSPFFDAICEMVKDAAIVTMEGE